MQMLFMPEELRLTTIEDLWMDLLDPFVVQKEAKDVSTMAIRESMPSNVNW